MGKMKKHCVGKCAKWKKNFVCHATCDKYKLTRKQQCRHKFITHGFQHICSKTRTKCVRWTGGRKCTKGPCLVTRKKAPNVVMMESIPKVRASFQKALADVSRREMKAQSAGKAALSHAKADLRVTLGASKAQVRALMLQARRDAAHAAVMAESHAKRALDDAKAKLASMQEVPHGAPRKEAVVPHGAPQKEAVLKIPPPLLKMPPLPGRVKTVEPATVEPLAVDVAAKQMVEGKDEHVAAQVAAPQLSSYNSKPDADFERVLAHPGEHFHP